MRPLRCLWIAAVVLGAVTCVESAALAEPVAAAGDAKAAEKERARTLVLLAADAMLADRWREAEALLRAAWDLDKTYDIAGNLGHVELINRKPRDAAEHLRFSLSTLPPTESIAQRDRVAARLRDARKEIAALRIRVTQPGADVRVDSAKAGTSPLALEVFVDPGRRVVTASLEGYTSTPVVIDAEKGGTHEITIEMARRSKQEAPPPKGAPGAEPPRKLEPKPAPPPLVAKGAPGALPSSSDRALYKGLLIGGSALALGSLGAGIGLTVAADRKGEKIAEEHQLLTRLQGPDACVPGMEPSLAERCAAQRVTLTEEQTLRTAAAIGFTVAAVSAAGTVVYAFLGRTSEGGTTVLPAVTRNTGALVVTGVW
jgi:hypothetical protein